MTSQQAALQKYQSQGSRMAAHQQKANLGTGTYVGTTADKESLRQSQMSQRSSASQRGAQKKQ